MNKAFLVHFITASYAASKKQQSFPAVSWHSLLQLANWRVGRTLLTIHYLLQTTYYNPP
jgi:hypothetical protein